MEHSYRRLAEERGEPWGPGGLAYREWEAQRQRQRARFLEFLRKGREQVRQRMEEVREAGTAHYAGVRAQKRLDNAKKGFLGRRKYRSGSLMNAALSEEEEEEE